MLDEGLALLVPAPLHDLVVDRVADARHVEVGGQPAVRGHLIARSSATQHMRREYVKSLAAAALLPDPLVGLVPVLAEPSIDARELDPRVVVDRRAVSVVEVDGVDQLAVDVELELVGGAVPDPHRLRAAVALEVVERLLRQLPPPVDPVHDLERARAPRRCSRRRSRSQSVNASASSVKPEPQQA